MPQLGHLKTSGCKHTYALTADTKLKRDRRLMLYPKPHVAYPVDTTRRIFTECGARIRGELSR